LDHQLPIIGTKASASPLDHLWPAHGCHLWCQFSPGHGEVGKYHGNAMTLQWEFQDPKMEVR
jgi:hypothetical protein